MVTIQSYMLLRKLIKMESPVIFNYHLPNHKISITEFENLSQDKFGAYSILIDKNKVMIVDKETYKFLILQGLIESPKSKITIKHKGKHLNQIIFGKLSSFIFRSILVPIIVAFITSFLITKFLTHK